jgi:hypothetical protein
MEKITIATYDKLIIKVESDKIKQQEHSMRNCTSSKILYLILLVKNVPPILDT